MGDPSPLFHSSERVYVLGFLCSAFHFVSFPRGGRMFLVVNALNHIMTDQIARPVPMAAAAEVVAPIVPIKRLGALIINSSCTTTTLVQYLTFVPNACDAVAVLEELCTRDYDTIFSYLLSLHATHWHKDILKNHLRTRLFDLSVPALKALSVHIPKLSALQFDDTTGTMQPFVGPLSSMVTSRWDTHDWYYQTLHAKQMEGQLLFVTISLSLLSRVTIRFYNTDAFF